MINFNVNAQNWKYFIRQYVDNAGSVWKGENVHFSTNFRTHQYCRNAFCPRIPATRYFKNSLA